MTITTSGTNPVTVEAISNTTTTSDSDRLFDINASIVGKVDSNVTVDGFGLEFTSTLPGSTISVTNDGTVTTSQNNGDRALHIVPGAAGNFGTFTYSGTGNVTNTGNGGALLVDNQGAGNVDITISGTSTISGSATGAGIEASTGTGTAKVTIQSGGTVEGQVAVSFGGGVDTLDNSGTVQGIGSLSSGVGGQVATVTNSAMISGTTAGVSVDDVTLTNNSGATIETTGTTATEAGLAAIVAVAALTAGDITNKSGATIAATGPFGQIGVLIGQAGATGDATVDNAGTISGALDGVNTNTTGTTAITNSGSITATGSTSITVRSAVRVNTATIENDQNGTISGGIGIVFRAGNAASTVFNDGTITGTGATPTAIQFSTGSTGNTLTLGTDSVINGKVLGAGSDMLQLGGTGSASFDVSNIGATAQYQGFSTFNKIGTSTWTLTGTGAQGWTVEQGTLQVHGTIGAATVQGGGTLDGTGTTGAVTVDSGGTLAPGDAPGTIATGNLDLETDSALSIEIGGAPPGVGGFDQVDVNGSVTLGGTLSTTLLNGFTPTKGETFEIINNDGNDAVNGTFAGLPEGATFTQGGVTYSISYVGGDGNDVVLTAETGPAAAAIHIVKFVNGQDADTAPGPHVAAGSTVTFTYVVTDTGSDSLANVTVTDDKLGAITSFTGDTNHNGLLDTGETWTYTATATAQTGQQTNVGTVTANDATNPSTTVTDADPANYFGDPPNPPPPAGTTANMITNRASTGDYGIYDLGSNSELAFHLLTNIASPSRAVALGNFSGTDTTDMAVRNGTAFQYFDVVNNNVTQTGVMGAVGTEWSVVGTGKFDSTNFTDMMMEKTTGTVDTFETLTVRNNQFAGANTIATVGNEWQLIGFGDVNGDGTTDMVLRNTHNGTMEYYDIANGQLASDGVLGAVGTEWQFVGFGNFDNSGFSDMIMRDSNNGAYDLYVIRNNQILSAHQIAAVGPEWQVAGFADLNGDGTTDMVLRNSNNGTFEYYDIANGQVTAEGVLGQSGPEWTVVGLTSASTTASNNSLTQMMPTARSGIDNWLTQAMQTQSSGAIGNTDAGPGFGANADPIAGELASFGSAGVTPNPLQAHTA